MTAPGTLIEQPLTPLVGLRLVVEGMLPSVMTKSSGDVEQP